ncbi:MAG: fasciclin domain-containing protein [Candidatus Hydrogenedentes bacterium]|nr:fasciclin domain-containing protein [Candidatus Hydrogenedentota bacterium]
MKKLGLNAAGIALCLALAVALGWNALPTNAADDTCPLKSGKAAGAEAKAGTCSAQKALLSKDAKGSCSKRRGAGPAVNKDAAGKATVQLAANAKGDCGECPNAKAAKRSANKDGAGECCSDKAAAKHADAKSGTCDAKASACDGKDVAKGEKGACDGKDVASGEKGACDSKDIAKLVTSDARFTTLALAVKAAGMTGEFACPNPKTVLAPTNEAFQKVPAEQWAAILQDDAKLKALLANHIIKDGALQSCALKDAKTAKSAGGHDLSVSACPQSGQVSIDSAKVVGDALVASNGIIHAIDSVLLPADTQVAKAEAEAPVQVAAAQ